MEFATPPTSTGNPGQPSDLQFHSTCNQSKSKNRVWLVRLFECLDLALIQLDLQRIDGLIQMRHLAGADDGRAYPGLTQNPRQSHLRIGYPSLLSRFR